MNNAKINVKRIMPIVTASIACVFMYLGVFKYGFWEPINGPLGGFYPTLIGALLFFVSVLAIFQSVKEKAPVFDKEDLYVGFSAAAVILMTFVLGMFPSIFLYLFLWIRFVEKASWKTTIISTVAIGGVAFLVFQVWLSVPFPKGLLMNMIS